jgi:AcrR family transcriptional regulator
MRYPPEQKANARAALVQASRRTMNTSGFNGVGVDGIAAAAGMTSGAFYSNFGSKEAMLEAVVEAGVAESLHSWDADGTKAERRKQLKQFIAEYLSLEHVTDPGGGCVVPTLSADVGRAGQSTRDAYQRQIAVFVGRVASVLDGSRYDREQRAWSIVALLVGAISVSRAMSAPEQQTKLVDAARRTADKLVGTPNSDRHP